MASLNSHDDLAIAIMILYAPGLIGAVICAFQHGLWPMDGWLPLLMYCIVRVVGAALQLATIGNSSSSVTGLTIGAITLLLVGLSPLTVASGGLLRSAAQASSINPRTANVAFRVFTVVTIAGLVTGVMGSVNAGTDFANNGVYKLPVESKVSVGLFAGSWGLLAAGTAVTRRFLSETSRTPRAPEGRLWWAVAIALPLLFVRILYTILSICNIAAFNYFSGKVFIYGIMVILPEFICLVLFLYAGLTMPSLRKQRITAINGFVLEDEETRLRTNKE